MTISSSDFPKSVGVIFLEDKDKNCLPFDQFACSHLLLQMNKIQTIFDFQVITLDNEDNFEFPPANFTVQELDKQITRMKEGDKKEEELDKQITRMKEGDKKEVPRRKFQGIEYWIGVTSKPISKNYFFEPADTLEEDAGVKQKVAIITSQKWDRYYTPPSLFEYIAICVLTCSLYLLSYDLRPSLTAHKTKSCIFDFTRDKPQRRLSIANPILCVKCERLWNQMENKLAFEPPLRISEQVKEILKRKWMGNTTKRDTPLYNLKKIYKYDVDRNSGYYKNWKEKFKDNVIDKLAEWTLGNLVAGFIGGLIVLAFALISGTRP